jgi:hypothetical protein
MTTPQTPRQLLLKELLFYGDLVERLRSLDLETISERELRAEQLTGIMHGLSLVARAVLISSDAVSAAIGEIEYITVTQL